MRGMKNIYIYFTGLPQEAFSEMEYSEEPTQADEVSRVYASLSSERIGEIYDKFMERIGWHKNPDGSPAVDGGTISPCVMFEKLLDVALYRTSAPFVLTRIRDVKTGEMERIERTVTSP